ncbi:glycosyltransferase family 4 protein [Agromyces larvae]|uniref:D-inositol 3-phosphate glycosyltransferase n=1 Tax=Agromyces larvae TaxID=2929802 RepID=A0ABY4BYT0_9MICO|nr:glycosyltransferase [Agromyces larvae]UOE44340.1 glycosyltransferase [Agromyces larvae]
MSARVPGALRVEAEPAFRTAHANPYNANLARSLQREGVDVRDLSYLRLLVRRTDIVHLHWPELTFLSGHRAWRMRARLALFFTFLRIARLRGTRLVWTVHNVEPHERRATPALHARYRRLLLGNVDGILALTEEGVDAARTGHPELRDIPAFVTPHGHYRDDYDFGATRAEAREQLGLRRDATVIASVGMIRPYKNIPRLLSVVRALDDPTLQIAIAGRASSPELARELAEAAERDPRVVLATGFQPDDRLARWLRAADLVVLPYTRIQNSGSAILALSADRPVLVPAIGAMRELAALVGDDWVRCYEGELDAATLADAIAWAGRGSGARSERPDRPDLSELDWPRIAGLTLDAYRAVLHGPSVAGRPPGAAHREPVGSR